MGITFECLGLTRADYLEQIIRENNLPSMVYPSNTWKKLDSLPSNTRYDEEIEVLLAEIQNLTQKNAALMERTARAFFASGIVIIVAGAPAADCSERGSASLSCEIGLLRSLKKVVKLLDEALPLPANKGRAIKDKIREALALLD